MFNDFTLFFAGAKTKPRWRTFWMEVRHVQPYTFVRQLLQVWCVHFWVVPGDIVPAEIIGQDDNKVRWRGAGRDAGRPQDTHEEKTTEICNK